MNVEVLDGVRTRSGFAVGGKQRELFAYRSSKCGWGSGCVDLWTGEVVGYRFLVGLGKGSSHSAKRLTVE